VLTDLIGSSDRIRCRVRSRNLAVLAFVVPASFVLPGAVGCNHARNLTPNDGYAFLIAGPSLYSTGKEEVIVRWFFEGSQAERLARDRCFFDIGAGHYKNDSATYYLEKHLNWSGFAFDRNARLGPDYEAHRKNTRFYSLNISDKLNDPVIFFDGVFLVAGRTIDLDSLHIQLKKRVLSDARCKHVDFLSISVDGTERKVLHGGARMLTELAPRLIRISKANQTETEIALQAKFMHELDYDMLDYKQFVFDQANIYFLLRDQNRL
jgi:hypothetical protein